MLRRRCLGDNTLVPRVGIKILLIYDQQGVAAGNSVPIELFTLTEIVYVYGSLVHSSDNCLIGRPVVYLIVGYKTKH